MQYFFPFVPYHLDFYWAPSLSSPAAAADSSCAHWQPPTLNVHVSLLQEKQSKEDLQPKGFVWCMYKAAGSVEMDAPRSALNSEGWVLQLCHSLVGYFWRLLFRGSSAGLSSRCPQWPSAHQSMLYWHSSHPFLASPTCVSWDPFPNKHSNPALPQGFLQRNPEADKHILWLWHQRYSRGSSDGDRERAKQNVSPAECACVLWMGTK